MALTNLQANITLDVYDHDGAKPSIKTIALDDNTRYVLANIRSRGEVYDIGSSATVQLIVIRPDKVGVQIAGQAQGIEIGQEDESVVTVYGAYAELDQPAIAIAGTLLGQFKITSGDQILRTQVFQILNGEALDSDTWAGDYDGYNLDELVADVAEAVEKVGDLETDVAQIKEDLLELQEGGYVADAQQIQEKVDAYLDEHPEATTTVQDGAITLAKLNSEVTNVIADKQDKFSRPFRIIGISDIHYSAYLWYNCRASDRMDVMVNALIEEHKKQPIDVLVIAGDLSSDNAYSDGTVYCKKLYDEYLYRLPFPVVVVAGNHDVHSNDVWKQITGRNRQCSYVFGDYVIIVLDNYDYSAGTSDSAYRQTDYSYINSVLSMYPDKKVILCGHTFNPSTDGQSAINVINDDQILFLMAGHSHTHEIRTYGNKKIVMCGHFSVALNNGSAVSDYDDTNENAPWGFQDIRMTSNGITSQYITPAVTYYDANNDPIVHPYNAETVQAISSYSSVANTADYAVGSDGITTVDVSKKAHSLTDGASIRPGSDLNDILNNGTYYCYDASTAQSLTNCPYINGGFKLIVENVSGAPSQTDSTKHKIQRILTDNTSYPEYRRRYVGSSQTFSEWIAFATKDDTQISAHGGFYIPKSSAATITVNDTTSSYRWSAIISCIGGAATNVASWFGQGYGAGATRYKLFPLNVGESLTASITNNVITITNANTSAGTYLYLHPLLGKISDFTIASVE